LSDSDTHLLLAAIVLTAWRASGGEPTNPIANASALKWQLFAGILGVLVLSMAGAVTALGDTLFPSDTIAEGFQADFSPASHFIVRLRVWHPVIASIVGFFLIRFSIKLFADNHSYWTRRFAIILGILFTIQLAAGMINLILLAPVWMQIVHLLLADLVWIFLILITSEFQLFGKGQNNEILSPSDI